MKHVICLWFDGKMNSMFFFIIGEEYPGSIPESSSDSEEDVLRRLRQHQQQQQQLQRHHNSHPDHHELTRGSYIHHHPQHHHHNLGGVVARGSPSQMSTRSLSVDSHYGHHPSQSIHPMAQQRSFDHGTSSHLPSHHQMQMVSSSSSHHGHHPLHLHHPVAPSPSSSFTSQSVRPLRVTSIRDVDDVTSSSSRRRPHSKGNDKSCSSKYDQLEFTMQM